MIIIDFILGALAVLGLFIVIAFFEDEFNPSNQFTFVAMTLGGVLNAAVL